MKIEAEIFRISEKTPEQDEFVMIRKHGEGYWTPKVYNAHYNCWDTADGDDYDCDVDENDVWLRLPNKNICDILQKNSVVSEINFSLFFSMLYCKSFIL